MTIKEAQVLLSGVFVDRGKDSNGVQLEGVCFADDYLSMVDQNKGHIYEAVSKAQQDSGLTFSFSYEVASKAVDILAGLEDWNDEEVLNEAIEYAVPVYDNDLVQIYVTNWSTVDKACEELGDVGILFGREGGSVNMARYGWTKAIRDMVQAIKSNIENICEEN